MPKKETSSSEGQRKKVYYMAQIYHGKKQRKYFSPSSRSDTSFKELGRKKKVHAIKQSQSVVQWSKVWSG
jgi:hypothetical protein